MDGFALTTILGYKKLWEIGFKGLHSKVLGSFAYAAQTMSLAFVDCPKRGKREALCGADVADVVGSMTIFVGSVLESAEYCDAALRAPRIR